MCVSSMPDFVLQPDNNALRRPSLTQLFHLLIEAKKPLVFHNGLVDLVFLYQNLYLNLPTKLLTFLADVEDLFPSGVFDTKYIAEYLVRTKASYLQYVFKSWLVMHGSLQDTVRFCLPRLYSFADIKR